MSTAAAPLATTTRPASRGRGRRLAELTTVAVLAAGLASGGTWAAIALGDGQTTSTSSASSAPGTPTALPISDAQKDSPDWDAVAGAVSPSVVAIRVSGSQGEGEGSGVVYDDAGHIVTNAHVVDGAQEVKVNMSDGLTYNASVTGTDPSTDLAVVTLDNPPEDLTPIALGDSSGIAVGDPTMAVGNPLGLSGTVTTGIVSALDRPVTTQASGTQAGQQAQAVVTNAIQTSAAINPGNSGGALVDAAGRLVGINSSIASLGSSSGQAGSIGIGFAIPVNQVKLVADQLVAEGSAEHAFLGVTPANATADVGSAEMSGARVESLVGDGPAAQAGIQEGDVIVKVGETRIASAESLVGSIRAQAIGSTVSVTLVRDGQEQSVDASLVAAPAT